MSLKTKEKINIIGAGPAGLTAAIVLRKYESRVKDKNCTHENCTCVWCRCGEKSCV